MPNITKAIITKAQKIADLYSTMPVFNANYYFENAIPKGANVDDVNFEPNEAQMASFLGMSIALFNRQPELLNSICDMALELHIPPLQINAFTKRLYSLDTVKSIDEHGFISEFSQEELDNDEDDIDGVEDEIVFDKKEEKEKLIDNDFDVKASLNAAYNESFKTRKTNNVLLDSNFFNEILKDESLKEIIEADDSDLAEPTYKEARNKIATCDDREDIDTKEGQIANATDRIKTYLILKNRSDNRGFLDMLKHPFNSIMEWWTLKGLKNDIKDKYSLTDEGISKIEDMYSDKRIPHDFVAFGKDGEEITINDNAKSLGDKLTAMYGKEAIAPMVEAQIDDKVVASLNNIAEDTKTDMEKSLITGSFVSESGIDDLDRSIDSI